jgi:hypothetical protein
MRMFECRFCSRACHACGSGHPPAKNEHPEYLPILLKENSIHRNA